MSGNSTATRKRHSRLPMIAQAGPVSVWMILFVTIPMLFIIFISFMTRGTFGGVEYVPTLKSYETLADLVYFNVILKSLRVALVTTVVCLLLPMRKEDRMQKSLIGCYVLDVIFECLPDSGP